MIKVILFDLDDTLYRERDFVYSGFLEVSKYIGEKFNYDVDHIYNTILKIFHKDGRNNIFDKLCNQYSINENIDKLVQVYRDTNPNIKLYDDAIYLLNKIRDGFGLGIITDGKNTVQWNKIKSLDVQRYMDKIIVTDDLGLEYWKPSKKSYNQMLEHFGGKANEFIYIGDNPNKDFISAKKMGINTIRIIREIGDHMNTSLSEEYEADYRINSLMEVENIIKIINGKS